MPCIIRSNTAQDGECTADKTLYIVVNQIPVNTHPPIFNLCRRRIMPGVAQMPGKLVLRLLKGRHWLATHDFGLGSKPAITLSLYPLDVSYFV